MSTPRQPPTAPGGTPLVGHTVSVLRDPLQSLERWAGTDADIVDLSVAGRRFSLVTAPALVQTVLATEANRYEKADIVRDRLGTLQGDSLVLLEGEQWRRRRELLQPAFARQPRQASGELTVEYATQAVNDWGTAVRADREMQSLSLAILARALFGLDLSGGRTPIHEAAEAVLARLNPRTPSAHLPEWVPTPTNYRYRQAVQRLHDRIDALVADAADGDGGDTLLEMMVTAGMDPEEVRDELVALLFAGYDSTATALTMTLGLLGEAPEIQADVRRELAETLNGGRPAPDDIEACPLLDAVVRESLRLYPPQYLLFRQPVEPVTLGGYRLAEGTTIVLSPWVCHRDPRHWDDPAQFRPRRWQSDADRPEFAYFPYGAGPRHCLGRGLAAQTIRLVVAAVCQHRQLQLQSELSVRAGPTLAPDPVELRTFPDDVSTDRRR